MVTVLVVDDHDIVRTGIKRLLSTMNGVKVVGEAANGEEAVQFVQQKVPDVILMDIKMPGIGGIHATKKLLEFDPDIKILAISSCEEEPFPTRLLQAGALGYVTKGCLASEMEHAIRAVSGGQRYISPAIAEQLAVRHMSKDKRSPFAILSERELEVMERIIKGAKVTDISVELGLNPKTVNSYRYRIFEKLGIKNDVELTLLAIRHGMLEERKEDTGSGIPSSA